MHCRTCPMETETETENFIIVPRSSLSASAVTGLVEEFILREGTDYGHSDVTLDQKKDRVFRQLEGGHIQIVFSSKTENCTLMQTDEIPKCQPQ